MSWLAGARPDLMEHYAGLYPRAYAPAKTQDELAKTVRELVTRHGGFDLKLRASGDLDVDQHHTVEDVGIALGEAVSAALPSR